MSEVSILKSYLMRIDRFYRESSGLPLAVQAYCMRSEAKVALGLLSAEVWNKELHDIQELYPDAHIAFLSVEKL